MRQGGQRLARIAEKIKEASDPGVTTKDLDQLARKLISKKGGTPSFLGYKGFPAAICTSVNETVVHGVPSSYELREGDLLSIDLGFEWRGYHTDMALTYPIGPVSEKEEKLMEVTDKALELAIREAVEGARLGDLGNRIENYVKSNNLTIVEGLCGHGIGKEVHEDPQVFNTGKPNTGLKIKRGLVFCIEPMVTSGDPKIKHLEDGIKTRNLSAHFEHTVAITENGTEILTAN